MDHYNEYEKQNVWEEIGKETGTSVDLCKKKVNYSVTPRRDGTQLHSSMERPGIYVFFDENLYNWTKISFV